MSKKFCMVYWWPKTHIWGFWYLTLHLVSLTIIIYLVFIYLFIYFYLYFFLSSLFLFCFCFSFCTLLEQDNLTLFESWMLFLNGDARDTRRLQMGCYTVCLASKMLYLVFTWVYPHWTNRSIWLAFTSGWSDTNLYLCLSYLEFVW